MTDARTPQHATGSIAGPRRRAARRGAVALEYILISALVAIGMISAFALWGRNLRLHLSLIAWDSSAALIEVVSPR